MYQLSGLADPVYCEAHVTVHDYDIVLEILVRGWWLLFCVVLWGGVGYGV